MRGPCVFLSCFLLVQLSVSGSTAASVPAFSLPDLKLGQTFVEPMKKILNDVSDMKSNTVEKVVKGGKAALDAGANLGVSNPGLSALFALISGVGGSALESAGILGKGAIRAAKTGGDMGLSLLETGLDVVGDIGQTGVDLATTLPNNIFNLGATLPSNVFNLATALPSNIFNLGAPSPNAQATANPLASLFG